MVLERFRKNKSKSVNMSDFDALFSFFSLTKLQLYRVLTQLLKERALSLAQLGSPTHPPWVAPPPSPWVPPGSPPQGPNWA